MREPNEFELAGRKYRITPMDARAAQHVARRVQPILIALIPAITAALPKGEMSPGALLNLDLQAILPGISAASDLLANMSDEAYDYIRAKCLARVQREKEGGTGWASIWSVQGERVLFEDIEGHEEQSIVVKVLIVELGPFFQGLLSSLFEGAQA